MYFECLQFETIYGEQLHSQLKISEEILFTASSFNNKPSNDVFALKLMGRPLNPSTMTTPTTRTQQTVTHVVSTAWQPCLCVCLTSTHTCVGRKPPFLVPQKGEGLGKRWRRSNFISRNERDCVRAHMFHWLIFIWCNLFSHFTVD